jgi:hypothetical protein
MEFRKFFIFIFILSASALAKSLGQQEWRDKKALILFNDESNDGLMKFYIDKDKDSIKFD